MYLINTKKTFCYVTKQMHDYVTIASVVLIFYVVAK